MNKVNAIIQQWITRNRLDSQNSGITNEQLQELLKMLGEKYE